MGARSCVAASWLAYFALGCGGSEATTGSEAGSDTGADVQEASASEASAEAGTDATASADADASAAVDASMEDARDAVADALPVDAGTTSFHGFLIGSSVVGSMSALVGTDQVLGDAGAFTASGIVALPGGSPTALTGTLDLGKGKLTLSGQGYGATGDISWLTISGDFQAPEGGVPFFELGADPETTYCGSIQGSAPGVIAIGNYAAFPPPLEAGALQPWVTVGLGTPDWAQVYAAPVDQDGGFYCTMSLGVVVSGTIDGTNAAGTWTQSLDGGVWNEGDGGTWTATTAACPPL